MKYTIILIFSIISFSSYAQEATSSKKIVNKNQSTENIDKTIINENGNSELTTSNKRFPAALPLVLNQNNIIDSIGSSGQIVNSSKRIPKE